MGRLAKKARVDGPQQKKKVPNFSHFCPLTTKGWRPLGIVCLGEGYSVSGRDTEREREREREREK